MFLDEILVQKEIERTQKGSKQKYEEIKAEILQKEKEQKAIYEYLLELQKEIVIIGDKEYKCKKIEVLDDAATLYIFQDDLAQLFEEKPVASVLYRTLEISATVSFLQMPVIVKNEHEYQQILKEQLYAADVPYQPVDSSNLISNNTKIFYATGITYNAAGGMYIINYFYLKEKGFVSGSFTCKLLERYTFENLFLAMLQLMCEENN